MMMLVRINLHIFDLEVYGSYMNLKLVYSEHFLLFVEYACGLLVKVAAKACHQQTKGFCPEALY